MATIATAQAGATSNLPRKPVPGLFSSLPTTIRKALRIPTPSQNPSNAGNGRYSAMTNTLAVGTGLQNSTTNMINGNQNNVCQNCHVYPRRLDPTSGVIHDFCSRSCAKANSAIKCEHCKVRPKYTDGKSTHPYCSRTCAKASKSNGNRNLKANLNANGQIPQQGNTMPGPPVATCSTPGCQLAVYMDSKGTPGKYCGKTHKAWAQKGCVACRKAEKSRRDVFCSSCKVSVTQSAPAVIEIDEENETFKSVVEQFERSWRNGTTCPQVRAIYKVVSTQQSVNKYNSYRYSVEASGNFTGKGRQPGNENRRWHGTRRKCTLGDKGCTTFCSDAQCSLCCIIKTSFDIAYCGKKSGMRFGAGVYTSSTSSGSDGYSSTESSSPWKAMLLNKVVVGKGYKIAQDDPSMTAPPAGYDSVIAEVGGGLNLPYDELVVYSNDAVRPSYLVMYE